MQEQRLCHSAALTGEQRRHLLLTQLPPLLQHPCQQPLHLGRRLCWARAALEQAVLCHSHPPAARGAAAPGRRHAGLELGQRLLLLLLLLGRRRRRMLLVTPWGSRLLAAPLGGACKPGAAAHEPVCISQPQRRRRGAVPARAGVQPLPLLLFLPLLLQLLRGQQLLLPKIAGVDRQARQQGLARGRGGGGEALQVRPGPLRVDEVAGEGGDACGRRAGGRGGRLVDGR